MAQGQLRPVRRAVRRATLVTVVVVAFLATTGGAAPAGAASAFPPLRPTRVLILGDSVLKGTVGQYRNRLAGRDVTIDAVVSRSTSASADHLARLGSDWDVVVVLLGYNDGGSARAFQPAATRILGQLAAVPRVVWLSLHEVRPGYSAVNQFITGQVARFPNLHTADWNAICNANPGSLAGDGIHPRGAGLGLLADLVTAQVTQAETDRATALQAMGAAAAETARQQADAQAVLHQAAARQKADADAAALAQQQKADADAAALAQQQADAALAAQHEAAVAWQQRQAIVAVRAAEQRAGARRHAMVASRRAQRIGLAVARTSAVGSAPKHRGEVGLVIGLAVLAVAGLGAGTIVGTRRRRPAQARGCG
jgi:hypothetical protein